MRHWILLLLAGLFSNSTLSAIPSPHDLIQQAMNHWRGVSSYSEITMTIHRPDWQRSITMQSWTQGDKISLVRVLEPKKDKGSGTLTKDNNMWTYSPKINRIIKIPSSMMNQSWMGSDFSNKDISKSTDILSQYEHSLLSSRQQDNHTVYIIESIPHEDAAVVWGKEITIIRDDYVLLEQQFWDQDGILIKTMKSLKIQTMDGRTVSSKIRMSKTNNTNEWTEMSIQNIKFNLSHPENMFTLSNLRNPRQ